MVQRPDRLVAEGAVLSLIPLRHDIPNQTVLRVGFHLLEAILATILPLGPSGTIFQPKRRFVCESSQGGFSGGNVHGFRHFGHRTSHQTFPAKLEIRLHSGDGPEHKQRNGQHKNSDDDEHRDGHKAPPVFRSARPTRRTRWISVWWAESENTMPGIT